MRKVRRPLPLALIALLASLMLLYGCCAYLTEPAEKASATQGKTADTGASTNVPSTASQNTAQEIPNKPPVVHLLLKTDSGPAPFSPVFTINCYDPEGRLTLCEMSIDGQVYAKGHNLSDLFPKDYEYPDFYTSLTNQQGEHTVEIFAVDAQGQNASKAVTFTVLAPPPLTKPGWYGCNELPNEPCNDFAAAYCDKFTPEDIDVRNAAAQAISKHPGAYSLNQLLDIYDWVHANVFYQNVPVNLTYQPYSPRETLKTKSGDCKNQAVLIASMVQAIGGSARVMLIPDCGHAFAEVYLGTDMRSTENLESAISAHYPNGAGQHVEWHTYRNSKNETEIWFIFDTAGGSFPGQTIKGCMDAQQTFVMHDCTAWGSLRAPEFERTAYGPYTLQNDTKVINPDSGLSYPLFPYMSGTYKTCEYQINVESRSGAPLNWYITNEAGSQAYLNNQPFSYFYGEEHVKKGSYLFRSSNDYTVRVIVKNPSRDTSITENLQVVQTCYKE